VVNKAIMMNFYSYDNLDGSVKIQLCPNQGGGGDCLANSAYAVRHPQYKSLLNDFALIFLPEDTSTLDGISPVMLNSDKDVPMDGEDLEVFGWGRTSTNQTIAPPRVPNTVKLNYIPNENCKKKFNIDDSVLCANGDGTTSIYKGDSGV
jgi:hypothetical protein